jgi:hypothetical protein
MTNEEMLEYPSITLDTGGGQSTDPISNSCRHDCMAEERAEMGGHYVGYADAALSRGGIWEQATKHKVQKPRH